MAQLITLGFKEEAGADAFISKLEQMRREEIIGLEDVVKVTRTADGKTKVKQGLNLAGAGAVSGAFWGMLIGLIFWMPWLGAAIGAASGAIGGKLSDIGIDDGYIKQTAESIKPGEAGVFMLVSTQAPDRVALEIEGTEATVIRTNLSLEQEQKLRELFPVA